MKRIDVHVHASMWKNTELGSDRCMASPEELIDAYRKNGIDKGIIMGLTGIEAAFITQSNEELAYIASKYPNSFYFCCDIDPRMGRYSPKTDFSEILMYYKNMGAVGVGELTANIPTDDPLMDNLFAHCESCDMPVTIHIASRVGGTYGIVDELGLPRLERMLKAHPDLKVIGHSQCFWSHISGDVNADNWKGYPTGKVTPGRVVELLREYPNLYCDLSADSGFIAFTRDPDFTPRFIEEFSDRLMFGTDFTRPGRTSSLAAWLDKALETGDISKENYDKICFENAVRVYNLK